MTMLGTVAGAQGLKERFERAEKDLLASGTDSGHMNSIKLVAQLIARDKVCPPDDRTKGYLEFETRNQVNQTGLARNVLVSRADQFVPMYVELLNSDPAEKRIACMP